MTVSMRFRTPDTPIHLTWDNPGKGRPKTFCGAKLRTGCLFTYYTIYIFKVKMENTQVVPIRQRSRGNLNSVQFTTTDRYEERVCPRCLSSDDYALACLAGYP